MRESTLTLIWQSVGVATKIIKSEITNPFSHGKVTLCQKSLYRALPAESGFFIERNKPMMFVHIPVEVASRKDLTITDKYVAGVILGLTKKNGFCHATNQHIAAEVGITPKSISRIVSHLAKLGVILIEVTKTQDERGRWKTNRLIRATSMSPLPTDEDTPSPQMRHINNKIENKNDTHSQRPITNEGFTRESLIEWWNKRYDKKFKHQALSQELFTYWCSIYTEKEIKVAIGSHQKHPYWGDKLTPQMLFKKTDSKGEALDVINQLLNFETDDPQVLRYRDALKGTA